VSNDRPARKPRRPEIPRLEMNPREAAATLGVVRRITGRTGSPGTGASPITDGSPTAGASPTAGGSPSTADSPVNPAAVAPPPASPSAGASPVTREQPKRRTRAEYRAGDSRINHDFFDAELCPMPPLSQLLWLHLNRYREGRSAVTIVLSWKKLAERFGDDHVSESTVRRAFKPLERTGLAIKDRAVFGKGGEQGIVFRLFTLDSPTTGESPSTHASNKRSDQKQTSKGNLPPADPNCELCHGSGFELAAGGVKGNCPRCRGGK
jgi:hypothetical protein